MSAPPRQLRLAGDRLLDVYVAGPEDGTALLFHNGTPGCGMPLNATVETMAERGLRYVSFSRPGYGSSTRQEGRSVVDVVADSEAVLDSIGAERCYVMGWSGGGPHALACAARMPDRAIATATVGGIAPYPADGLDWMAGMGAENIAEFGAARSAASELAAFLDREAPKVQFVTGEEMADAFGDLIDDVDRGSLTGDLAEYVAASFREGLRIGHWGWFDDDMAFIRPWGFDLSEIGAPVFIWQGGHDRMVPYAHGEWLATHIPGARPRLLVEHGHLSLAVGSIPRILDEMLAVGR